MPDARSDPDRSSLLDVTSYQLTLDLTHGAERFSARTEVSFRCRPPGVTAYADLYALSIGRATLNGADLGGAGMGCDGRLHLPRLAADNVLVVEAEFGYAADAAGLHYVTGPEAGCAFVYGRGSATGAARMYCCFDEPDLRAPFTVSVQAPARWACLGNAPVLSRPSDGEAGLWRFAPTPAIPPWLASFCAGCWSGSALSCEQDRGDPLPVTVQAAGSAGARLDHRYLADLLTRPLRYYQRKLGVRYPYGTCDLVFGPISPALAYSATGLIIVQDQVLADEPDALFMATVVAHELAHAWFGGLVTMSRADAWLDEALTTYISRAAVAQTVPGATPWDGATSAALPDQDYARDAAAIRHLEDLIGPQAVLDGLGAWLRRHAHGEATKDDLVRCWSQASGQDLRAWAFETLRPGAPGLARPARGV